MKRLGKLYSVVAIALLGVIAAVWSARDPGPRVEGRSVREWMLSRIGDDEKRAVLRSLGDSAVPPLLAMLDEQPGLDERGLDWFRRVQPLFRPRVIPAGNVNFAGAHGLSLLGDPATNALAALRERFDRTEGDDRRRFHCAYALARLGPEGIAFLESRVEDAPEHQTSRLVACFDFNNYEPQAGFELALRLARRLGPERRRAVWLAMYQIEEPRWSEYRGRFQALLESGSAEERVIASEVLEKEANSSERKRRIETAISFYKTNDPLAALEAAVARNDHRFFGVPSYGVLVPYIHQNHPKSVPFLAHPRNRAEYVNVLPELSHVRSDELDERLWEHSVRYAEVYNRALYQWIEKSRPELINSMKKFEARETRDP